MVGPEKVRALELLSESWAAKCLAPDDGVINGGSTQEVIVLNCPSDNDKCRTRPPFSPR